ncbi:23S rRNA (pseudouridine(1915)-N(3))-methyltransferase RlmH [Barnesiella sp. WM24]|uniref:23S rRNA (pseudouridine(1915)-N(3))-methyltransferase RlmH n=1 Tax=Barnesiella sp. WM24 TaxID=2558278 RepID=UPI000A5D6BAF|nr:23S rRNA (pseudouridine(1915)-N(3))-methyltransferase RlmH [Barnesiella sp. WM24]MDE6114243.1 23S rRNA (pseudouridine(1915)-N(3))-methyltransferase RlmH [Muribaculum sp.]TFU94285.1 23S rRNA (pseudouridine(1915)-N(3))-methyltransferase RlmH [Barnesiella sp. WM24]
MKIELMAIGRTSTRYLQDGIDVYLKRLSHYVPFEIKCLPDVKTSRSLTEERQKEMEGEQFLAQLQPGDFLVLLDERGKEMTSRDFSVYIDRKMSSVPKRMLFVIGGPYGFSKAMYERADDKISLSKMTFSHEMVRLFFTEQLYRAMTILRGEPYHHD